MNKLLERSDGEKCRPHMTIPAGTTNSLNINCDILYVAYTTYFI